MVALRIDNNQSGITFCVKIVPASSRTEICGLYEDMLKIKLSAPPEKGKANKELIGFLAKTLGIRKNQIAITSGLTNPVKTIKIVDIPAERVLIRLKQEINEFGKNKTDT